MLATPEKAMKLPPLEGRSFFYGAIIPPSMGYREPSWDLFRNEVVVLPTGIRARSR